MKWFGLLESQPTSALWDLDSEHVEPGPVICKLQAPLLRLWGAEGANDGLQGLAVLFVWHPWARKLPPSSSEHSQARLKRGSGLASLCSLILFCLLQLLDEFKSPSQWGQIRRNYTDVFQWGRHSSWLASQRKNMSSPPTGDSHIRQGWLAALPLSTFTKKICYVWGRQSWGRKKGNPLGQRVGMPTCLLQNTCFANFSFVTPAVTHIPVPYKTWLGAFCHPSRTQGQGGLIKTGWHSGSECRE